MENLPRVRYVSVTFIVGFGIGIFAGVALALTALFFVKDSDADSPVQERVVFVPAPSAASTTPTVAATPVQIRTRTKEALDVRLGPGSSYAIVGVLAKGNIVDAVGRDAKNEWLAIPFPPGSTGRGWLPVSEVEGFEGIEKLAVAAATPIPRSVSVFPTVAFNSNDPRPGLPTLTVPELETPTPLTGTAVERPPATPTSSPRMGSPDLAVTQIVRLNDGRVRMTIKNQGPGDLVGQSVFVVVRDLATISEVLVSAERGLDAGQSITIESQTFHVLRNTTSEVTATVDPYTSLNDPNRANNSLTVQIVAPARPTETPVPGRE